jgi:hypothetical protein
MANRPMAWLPRIAFGLALLAGIAACKPEIGDKCVVSTDCSANGDRLCDTSQPGGYCTQLNCGPNSCPDQGSCVLFGSSIPGCGFDDRSSPTGSRVSRSFCMAMCETNGDCRSGYVCAAPTTFPWNAVILDDDQAKKSCLPVPFEGQDAAVVTQASGAPVCSSAAVDAGHIEASAPSIDAGTATVPPLFPDAGKDAAADADAGSPGPADAATDGG